MGSVPGTFFGIFFFPFKLFSMTSFFMVNGNNGFGYGKFSTSCSSALTDQPTWEKYTDMLILVVGLFQCTLHKLWLLNTYNHN